MPLTWARDHGIDTRIPGFAHRDQDSRRGFNPHGMEARHQAERPALPATPAILVAMKSQNIPQHTFAHPRLHRAHLHPSLRQGGRESLPRPPSERLQISAPLRTTRAQAAQLREPFALLPCLLNSAASRVRRPAFSPAPWQNFARNALQLRPLLRTAGASSPRPFRHRRRRNPAQLPRIIGFCPPILSVLALPQAPAPGEKKGRRHLLRPLKRSPRKPVPGLLKRPCPTDRAFLPSRSFSRIK